jgi:hypothetical protein
MLIDFLVSKLDQITQFRKNDQTHIDDLEKIIKEKDQKLAQINATREEERKRYETQLNLNQCQIISNGFKSNQKTIPSSFNSYNEINKLFEKLIKINETLAHTEDNNKKNKKIAYSLAHDISINDMKSLGYRVVYDYSYYSHSTTITELTEIKSMCSVESILCAGGAAKNSDNLLLVSCGNCRTVLTETAPNKPVLDNGAYWYLTDRKSFGFAPVYNINQNNPDVYDCKIGWSNCNDDKRLSWNLPGRGWRLGRFNDFAGTISNFRKIILIL